MFQPGQPDEPIKEEEELLSYKESDGRGKQNVVVDVIDCRRHYGVCYRLSSGTVGGIFNDGSAALLSANEEELLYRAKGGGWEAMSAGDARQAMDKKFKLMK